MIQAFDGSPVLLSLSLADGTSSLFPQAAVYDDGGTPVTTVDLSHVAGGLYQGTLPAQSVGQYSAHLITYTDPAHTTPSTFERVVEDVIWITPVADAVWDEAILGHVAPGSAAEALVMAFGDAGGQVRDDALAYDANSRPTLLRRRIFPDAATANASTPGGTGEGEVITVTISATHLDAARWQSLLRTI